jgi:hypothetical protein
MCAFFPVMNCADYLSIAIDDNSRILTKYYSNPHPPAGNQADYPGQIAYKTVKDQKAFEKGLLGSRPRNH